MLVFLIYFCFSKIQTVYSQIPEHLDLENVGEIVINNENYKLLRPSAHKVTDYFQDFVFKRSNLDPSQRIFMDHNGLRHFWSGFNNNKKNSQNLRKASIPDHVIKDDLKNRKNKDGPKRLRQRLHSNEPLIMKPALRDTGGKVARATFFCPFFGVITLTSKVD